MRQLPYRILASALSALPAALGLMSLFASAPAHAQLSQGGTPPSQDATRNAHLLGQVPFEVMPEVDVARLKAEDEQNVGKAMPWRFGHNIAVDISPATHGIWSPMADGGRLWRLGIYSEDAFTINLLFDQYRLPPGAELFVRSVDKNHTIGKFTDANNQATGMLPTTLVDGSRIVIEYYEPANPQFAGTLHLSRVTHGYRDVYGGPDKAFGSSGACNNNAICPISAGWEDQIKSTVMLVSGGNGFCTGSLINNTSGDLTPYILTANHCYSNPSGWVFWFGWQSPTCQNPPAAPEYNSLSGAVLRARRADSDFCLVELNDPVPDTYDPYWAGFDYTGAVPPRMVGIHHPSGDIKKFSIDNDPGALDGYGGGGGTDHWRVTDWDDGTTEGGSSGSALFDQNKRIIGQLHGGGAACGNNESDWYGAVSVSWDGNNASQRLRDWLDPANMDPGAVDGTTPNQFPRDASISAVTDPASDSTTCDTEVLPVVVLRNAGTDDLTSVDIEYSVNGGGPDVYNWTGLLPTGATESVTLPNLPLMPGVNTLDFATVNPNGAPDDNPANDLRTVTVTVLEATGVPLPLVEDFEGAFPPANWIIDNPDGAVAWELGNVSGFGVGNGSASYNNFDDDHRGTTDALISPFLDLGPAPATLQFDVAYARYSANLIDRMEVMMSPDCGLTWNQLWSKSDNELSTTGMDVEVAFTPAADQWRTEVIDLSPYAGIATAQFAFVSVTGWGNNLYIDNINFGGAPPDADGDGFTSAAGDCNDNDPNVNPDVPELQCDGIDNDCNPATDDGLAADGTCAYDSGGCCSTTDMTPGSFAGMLLLFGLVVVSTRRRRRDW